MTGTNIPPRLEPEFSANIENQEMDPANSAESFGGVPCESDHAKKPTPLVTKLTCNGSNEGRRFHEGPGDGTKSAHSCIAPTYSRSHGDVGFAPQCLVPNGSQQNGGGFHAVAPSAEGCQPVDLLERSPSLGQVCVVADDIIRETI